MKEGETNNRQEDQMEANDATLVTRVSDEGFWKEMWRQVRLVWYLLRSPDVPLYLKVLPALAVVYVLIPTDLIPDIIPVVGQLDDITALLVGAKVFIELSPQEVVTRYIQSVRGQAAPSSESDQDDGQSEDVGENIVIDGDYQIIEDEE